ncbi:unnamed protein product [Lactuca saligna]|uniref:Uncharacterized protein n=1 Tax=Lactuca saligna TaxID=75948 RepID=A0AA36E6E1_LACSI|nr:unnamed protein product [Lactuca saligna]
MLHAISDTDGNRDWVLNQSNTGEGDDVVDIASVVYRLTPPLFFISCCRYDFVHGGPHFSVTTTTAAWLDSVTRVAASAIGDCLREATIIANHRRLPPVLLPSTVAAHHRWVLGLFFR